MKKERVNLWLMGGFGNVLFQMNYGYYLKSKGIDVSFISTLTNENFITKYLLRWKIHQNLYTKVFPENEFSQKSILYTIICLISIKLNFTRVAIFIRSNSQDFKNSKNLFGYFQDSIDLDSLEIMRGVFHHFMRRNNQIYLHIRGTDSDWALMYSKYYNLVVNHHFVKGNEIVLATDDLKRAKDVLKDSCKYVQSKSSNAFDDFIYMLGAKYLIISPSTFSLWALLLNDECEFAIAPDIFRKYFTFSRDNLTIEFLG